MVGILVAPTLLPVVKLQRQKPAPKQIAEKVVFRAAAALSG
jgi:hypothetical protein